jgi:hypothetical protein
LEARGLPSLRRTVPRAARHAAADIDETKVAATPGFGKNLTDRLAIWRAMKEKIFVPHTGAVIDPHDVQRIDRRLAARRAKLMKDVRKKITEVEQRMRDYIKVRDTLWARVEAAYQARLVYRQILDPNRAKRALIG